LAHRDDVREEIGITLPVRLLPHAARGTWARVEAERRDTHWWSPSRVDREGGSRRDAVCSSFGLLAAAVARAYGLSAAPPPLVR
jgi:hypothetical protein